MVRGEAQQWEHQSMARQRRQTNFSAVHGGYQAVLPSPCWPCMEADSYRDIRVRLYACQHNHVHLFVCNSVYWLTQLPPGYPLISSHICKSTHPSIPPHVHHASGLCVPTCLSSHESVSYHSAKDRQWVAENTHHKQTIYTCMSIHRRGGEMRNWEWQEGNKPTLYWKDISWCWHSWSTHWVLCVLPTVILPSVETNCHLLRGIKASILSPLRAFMSWDFPELSREAAVGSFIQWLYIRLNYIWILYLLLSNCLTLDESHNLVFMSLICKEMGQAK